MGDINQDMLTLHPTSHLHRLMLKYGIVNTGAGPTRITSQSSTSLEIIPTSRVITSSRIRIWKTYKYTDLLGSVYYFNDEAQLILKTQVMPI